MPSNVAKDVHKTWASDIKDKMGKPIFAAMTQ